MPENEPVLWVEIIGWTGSLEILLAYALSTYRKVKPDSVAFLLLNLTGGLLLIVYTIRKEAFASTFINLAWVLIAVLSLARLFRRPLSKTPDDGSRP